MIYASASRPSNLDGRATQGFCQFEGEFGIGIVLLSRILQYSFCGESLKEIPIRKAVKIPNNPVRYNAASVGHRQSRIGSNCYIHAFYQSCQKFDWRMLPTCDNKATHYTSISRFTGYLSIWYE